MEKEIIKEARKKGTFEDALIYAIQEAKKEVFDDIEKVWKKCQNKDIREMILKDLEELEKHHLSTFKEKRHNSSSKKDCLNEARKLQRKSKEVLKEAKELGY